jgi:hypothetical protein
MPMFIRLDDRHAARWTILAAFHFRAWQDSEHNGQAGDARWHQDAYEFITHMQELAKQARKDGAATCPICDGRGVV